MQSPYAEPLSLLMAGDVADEGLPDDCGPLAHTCTSAVSLGYHGYIKIANTTASGVLAHSTGCGTDDGGNRFENRGSVHKNDHKNDNIITRTTLHDKRSGRDGYETHGRTAGRFVVARQNHVG